MAISPATDRIVPLLQSWLRRSLSADTLGWLDDAVGKAAQGESRAFFVAFSQAPRRLGKADLGLTAADLADADAARPGWSPQRWTVDQAARTRLVLALPAPSADPLVAILDKLFAAADVGELVALYQMLPLLPHADAHRWRTGEGIRTNMKAVFQAVAHDNPYPAEQLDEMPWNQLVLKCQFIGLVLDPVQGLDRRANPSLARMLCDYAHERWAAGRPVSPELWRAVGPHAGPAEVKDLQRVVETGGPLEKQAGILALLACPDPAAAPLLQQHADLVAQANAGVFSWQAIARAVSAPQG